ncbi:chitin synthase chs-2-like isoform X2 [Mytilus californianus]|uniref:chitin synthase chs-2-like isoform X2 n=1 Tax=Mytilus californianus TaxID=6549 RepID=UPI0022459E9D|nr:chitin synthase chs-2-like isoform X2 [Mytilus californianus]
MLDRRRFSQQTSRISNSVHHTLKTNIDNKSAEGADLQWNESKCPPPEKILKIAFAISLFIIVLGSGFIARVTFHILMWHISPPIMSNDSNINRLGGLLEANCSACNRSDCSQSDLYFAVDEIWIWAVFLVIVAPYFLTFLSTFFRICFKTNKRLEWKVLFAAMFIETVHSIGVSILAFLVLPSFDPASASVIYMAVALVPATVNVVDIVVDKRLHQNTKVSKYSPFNDASMLSLSFPVLGIVFQIIGIILIGLYIDRGWLSGIFVVAALFTSVKYWENFITMGDEDAVFLRHLKRELHVGRTKVTCLANIWKITITFLTVITIFTSKSDDPMAAFKSLFNNGNATIFSFFGEETLGDNPICQYNVPLLIAVITIICDYLCYKATKTVCAIYCQRFGFGIPMVILPVATTFTLVGLMHTPDILKFESCDLLFSDWCVKGNGNLIENCTELFVAFFLLYFSILLITKHVWKVNGYKHGETARIFVQPFYCGMLIDISLLLNRRRYDKEYDIVHKKKFENRKRKMLYACCATMWHETANEMTQLLKSIFRLDMKQFTTEMIAESAKDDDQVEPFDFEGNVFFDDAFDPPKEGQPGPDVNGYVKTFIQVINEAGSAVHGKRITIPDGQMYRTPYGARIYWDLPGGNKLVVHLKDKNKIRRKKRWSQVMYMFYILKWTLVNQYGKAGLQEAAENTYLLALDGDVDFEPEAVLSLMKRMNKSPLVGAVCGRIHPIGSGPMVWYQKFEYAISHWLQKATEHVLGCVLCSPGCFSLFRGSAILHPDVLDTYTTDSTEAEHFIQYDQGEDRWLCTLLLKQGWKIEYCAESDAYTYAPEGFHEFYNQRRRWVPSTMINVLDVIMDWKQITNNNENISFLYIVYHSILFASVLLTPGTIFMLVFGAIILGFESIPPWLSLVLNLIPVGIFLIMTLYASQQRQTLAFCK